MNIGSKFILSVTLVVFFVFNTGVVPALAYTNIQDINLNPDEKSIDIEIKQPKQNELEIIPIKEKDIHIKTPSGRASHNSNNQIQEVNLRESNNSDFNSLQSKISEISNINGLKGSYNVDKFSGASTYSYDIVGPPARTLTPSISLNYNSLNSSHGFIGKSWQLSLSYIGLYKEKGVDTIYNDNQFEISFDGSNERLFSNQANLYYLETESSFLTIEKLENYWLVTDKSGTKYYFGQTNNAKHTNTDNDQIYRWYLNKVEDTNSNYIEYDYLLHNGTIYPRNIKYTGNNNLVPDKEIRFQPYYSQDFPAEEKNIIKFNGAWPEKIDYLLESVEIFVHSESVEPLYLYDINYNDANQLTMIQETGISSSGESLSFPPTIFEYYEDNRNFTTSNESSLPEGLALSYFTNQGVYENNEIRWFDINGDGTEDIVKSIEINNQIQSEVYLNHLGQFYISNIEVPIAFVKYGSANNYPNGTINQAIEIFDIDGDNKLDIIESYSNDSQLNSIVYINNGNGFNSTNYPTIPLPFAQITNGEYTKKYNYKIFDINADGLNDIVSAYETDSDFYDAVYINFGNGVFVQNTDYNIPLPFSRITPTDEYSLTSTRPLDINNDGLTDIVKSIDTGNEDIKETFLNQGNGQFINNQEFLAPLAFANLNNGIEIADPRLKLIDINADKLFDFVQSYRINGQNYQNIKLNNGNGKFINTELSTINMPFAEYNGTSFAKINSNFALDINHDGNIDFIKNYKTENNSFYNQQKNSTYKASGKLKSITSPFGAQTLINYQSSSYYANEDGSNSNDNLPFTYDTVQEIQITANGQTNKQTYHYAEGEFIYHTLYDKEFVGFGIVKTFDNDNNKYIAEYYHQGGGFYGQGLGEHNDNKWKKGKLYRTAVYAKIFDDNFFKISDTRNQWMSLDLNENAHYVYLNKTISQSVAVDGFLMTAIAYEYDNHGNVIQTTDYGQVANVFSYDVSDINTDKYITMADYTTGQIQQVYQTRNFDQYNLLLSHSKNYYDNLPLGQIDSGLLTNTSTWTDNTNQWQDNNIVYNNIGNVISTINSLGHTNGFTYDNSGDYQMLTTNDLGHTSFSEFNKLTGQTSRTVDSNGYIEETTFDALGRSVEFKQSRLNSHGLITIARQSYEIAEPGYIITLSENTSLSTFSPITSKYYYDELNRLVQLKRETNENVLAYSIRYLPTGEISQKTTPYRSNNLEYSAWPSDNSKIISYTYDALDRLTQENNVLGSVSLSYYLFHQDKTDIVGHRTRTATDIRGNVISLTEYLNNQPIVTTFNYNTRNQLIGYTDDQGNTRNFIVNNSGNYTAVQDLHRPNQTDFITHNYEFDILGRKISESHSSDNSNIEYQYDSLNRLTNKTESPLNTSYTLTYDQGANAIGRLTSISRENYSKNISYDIAGNIIREEETIDSNTFITEYHYDDFNKPTSITYPDGEIINYHYDEYDNIIRISRGNNEDIVSSASYDFLGQMTSLTYANGVVQNYTYDEDSLYRLTNKESTNTLGQLQNFTYTYTANGNVLSISNQVDNILNGNWEYKYDDLNRLLEVHKTSTARHYNIEYQYDSIGNMLFNSRSGPYSYDAIHPHATSSVGNYQIQYDSRGNITNQYQYTLGYDVNNKLYQAVSDAQTINFNYNLEGNLINKQIVVNNEVQSQKFFINNLYEKDAESQTNFIFLSDQRVAQIDKRIDYSTISYDLSNGAIHTTVEKVFYYLPDHLGSSSVITDEIGRGVEFIEYYPFGYTATDTDAELSDYKFNDKRLDDDLRLYFYGNRFYNPQIGRFVSPDPLQNDIPSIASAGMNNSQYLNAYAYANNNPVKYIDPDGQIAFLAAMAIAAVVGAAIDAAIEIGVQMYENGSMDLTKIDYKEVGKSALVGAAWGAAGFGVGAAIGKAVKGVKVAKRASQASQARNYALRSGQVSNGAKAGIKLTEEGLDGYMNARRTGLFSTPSRFKAAAGFNPVSGELVVKKSFFKKMSERIISLNHEGVHIADAKKWKAIGRPFSKFESYLSEAKAYGLEQKYYKFNSKGFRNALNKQTENIINAQEYIANKYKGVIPNRIMNKYGSHIRTVLPNWK